MAVSVAVLAGLGKRRRGQRLQESAEPQPHFGGAVGLRASLPLK